MGTNSIAMNYTPYSSDMDNQPAPQSQTGGARRSFALKWIAFFLFIAITAGGVYWVGQKFPDKMEDLLIAVDRFGITEVGAAEQRRIRTINRLRITYEEKQVLIQRTVFLGASREMVFLALGDPVCVLQTPANGKQAPIESWVYYIEGDRKPTQLSFQNNELTTAGKASALDTCK